MGQRGPAPKPAELVNLEGRRATIAGHRKSKAGGEVVPLDLLPALDPKPSLPFDAKAKSEKVFQRLVKLLEGSKLLRASDEMLVRTLAESVERYTYLTISERQMRNAGEDDPYYGPGSVFDALHKETKLMMQLARELGLTPASRTRLMLEVALTNKANESKPEFDFNA